MRFFGAILEIESKFVVASLSLTCGIGISGKSTAIPTTSTLFN
jgi:hypothetical protein